MQAHEEPARCNIDAPVTTVIARRVCRGSEAAFEEWLHGIIEEVRRFEGHEGTTVLRPRTTHVPEYLLIVRFSDADALGAWNHSPERRAWLEAAAPLVERVHHQQETGLETWFTLPGEEAPHAPPRWKMALVSWIAIYPIVLVVNLLLVPFLEHEHVLLPLRTLIVTTVLTPTMTWVVMPQATKLFWRFLYPGVPRR